MLLNEIAQHLGAIGAIHHTQSPKTKSLARWFRKDIYKDRYKVERTFGWDTYRKLALSYDKLKETRLGFRNLAYSMINFRVTFNDA